jgi:hypothetical protein
LGRNKDTAQARVDTVAQRKVDNSVGAAEKNRRLGTVSRERVQALSRASGKQYDQRVVNHGLKPLIRKGSDATCLTCFTPPSYHRELRLLVLLVGITGDLE